jgi:hypothetical protein
MARGFACAVLVLWLALPVASSPLSPDEARTRWRERLAGRHFVANVRLTYRIGTTEEERVLTVWRDDAGAGERFMARFEQPPRLRGFSILFLEQPGKQNDYFVYQPELRRVRRIAERTASEDIYGVDLEVLAFGVAQSVRTRCESLEPAAIDGKTALRLVERALDDNQRFDRRITHLDPETFLPLRVEHRRGGETVLVAVTEESATTQGVTTPRRTLFSRPHDSAQVLMTVESIDFEKPIPGAFFSTLALVPR